MRKMIKRLIEIKKEKYKDKPFKRKVIMEFIDLVIFDKEIDKLNLEMI